MRFPGTNASTSRADRHRARATAFFAGEEEELARLEAAAGRERERDHDRVLVGPEVVGANVALVFHLGGEVEAGVVVAEREAHRRVGALPHRDSRDTSPIAEHSVDSDGSFVHALDPEADLRVGVGSTGESRDEREREHESPGHRGREVITHGGLRRRRVGNVRDVGATGTPGASTSARAEDRDRAEPSTPSRRRRAVDAESSTPSRSTSLSMLARQAPDTWTTVPACSERSRSG
jgi:hypothetical protein